MSYLDLAKNKLFSNLEFINEIFDKYNATNIKLYGYFNDNSSIGAAADLNFLVELNLKDDELYDWEDIDKYKLENELSKFLQINVKVDTQITLKNSLYWYSDVENLIDKINENAYYLANFQYF